MSTSAASRSSASGQRARQAARRSPGHGPFLAEQRLLIDLTSLAYASAIAALATALWAVSGAVAVVAVIVVLMFLGMGQLNSVGGAISSAVVVAAVFASWQASGFIARTRSRAINRIDEKRRPGDIHFANSSYY